MEKSKFSGYKVAIGAFIVILCCMGVPTTFGAFLNSIARYSEWDVGTVGFIGTACTVGCVIFSFIASALLNKIGPRLCMLIGVLACTAHPFLYMLATPGKGVMSLIFLLAGGFVCSIAIAFGTHAACSVVISRWFVQKREQISGMVFSGAGFGAAGWVFLASLLLSVFDVHADPVSYKWCYLVISIICVSLGLFAIIFLLRDDPSKLNQQALGANDIKQSSNQALMGVTRNEALKTPAFWILSIALLLICAAGSTFLAYAETWWALNGMNPTEASAWFAVFLVLAGLVLMVVGKVVSKIGTALFTIIVHVAFGVTMALMVTYMFIPHTIVMIALVLVGSMTYPLAASMPGLMGQSLFGIKDFAKISSILMVAVYCGQFIYNWIMSAFLGSQESPQLGMMYGWICFGIMALTGMALILVAIALSPMRKLKKANANTISEYDESSISSEDISVDEVVA